MVKLPGGSEDPPSIHRVPASCRMGCRSFWKDLAPMCIHVHVDNVGRFLETVQRPQSVGWMVECLFRQRVGTISNLVGVLADGNIEWFV